MPRRAKDAVIALLVVVNVVLLCTVLSEVIGLPNAFAQAAGQAAGQPGAGPFLAISGEVQSGSDVQYVIDTAQQRLYTYSPTRSGSSVLMQLTDVRDLRADFAKQPTPVIPPRRR